MRRQLRDANENRITGRQPATSPERSRERVQNGDGSAVRTAKSVRDGHENNRSQRGRGQRVEEPALKNSQLKENPAAQIGPDQSQNNVCDAAEAAAARKLSSKPPCNQAKEKP